MPEIVADALTNFVANPEPDKPAKRRYGDNHCDAKRRAGTTCRRPAGWGTSHPGHGTCKLHGGSTPNIVKHVEAQVVEAKARKLFGKLELIAPVHNPLEAYAAFAGRVVGWMQTLDELIHDLSTPGYAGLTGEQIRAEVQLFERALALCNTVLSTYAKLNTDERLVRIDEAKLAMFNAALDAGLAAVGITGARAVEAKRAAGKQIRVLEAQATVSDTSEK